MVVLLLAAFIVLAAATITFFVAWTQSRARIALVASGVLGLMSVTAIGLTSLDEDVLDAVSHEGEAVAIAPFVTSDPFATFAVEPVTATGAFSLPTAFAVGDQGELYVGHDFGIAVVRDTTGDGQYDGLTHFGLEGGWTFGLHYFEGSVYAASGGSVFRLTDFDGDDFADEVELLTDGLPHDLYAGHSNNGLAVGPDRRLYMTVGGSSDHGPEFTTLGGTILTMPVEGGAPDIYATGFRNPYDLAFCPDGRLFAADNGPDQFGDNTSIPWDEVNLVVEGGNYGYPDHFGPVPAETGTISPIASLAPSAAATGIVCYAGGSLPSEYDGNLFVTLWGTYAYPYETGRRVMRVKLEETAEGTRATSSEFAKGFGHPIDIVQDVGGNLLVLDHEFGQIFRISVMKV